MAIPKEPRQKMINMMYLVLTALLALNVSAEILNAFKTVDQSLIKSNLSIRDQVENIKQNFDAALKDPKTAANAALWKPKAEQVSKLSKELTDFIETLKTDIKVGAGDKGDGKFKDDDLDVTTRLIINNGKGDELKEKLTAYIEALKALDTDPKDSGSIAKMIAVDVSTPKTESNFDWKNSYFHMVPTVAGLTILSKFQNDVSNTESKLNDFFYSKVSSVKVIYDKFAALTGANSTYFMPNQTMEITAGVGSFSADAKPVISINGASVATDADGVAKTSFNVGGSGSKTANVVIQFTKPDGSIGTLNKPINYVVGIPSESSIFLEKMNVFYIGVDNPVTISSAAGWDKTNVSTSNCTFSGSNGKGNVRVSSEGKSTITVTSDGKANTFEFRNYLIPTPPVKLGDLSPGPHPTGAIISQLGLVAVDQNFLFDADFIVTGFSVIISKRGGDDISLTNSGATFSSQIATAVRACTPGSRLTFYNIRVKGPDGKDRESPGIGYICK
jgi:gliding motility-associated protein GldM